ncbi:MAG: PTS sugar transporter subunit IIB [Deltaproteobacteria bacterium]|nr:PTS sugar transporter subunit IIB [Deltaproteobacteria bacterium]
MLTLVRVDDRLLHGQIICAWVPFVKADSLVVASDEAAGDSLISDIIESCGCKSLSVNVENIDDAVKCVKRSDKERVILIVGNLADAMRVYEQGLRFTTLNLGNIHHEDSGRKITPSVIVNREDEEIIGKFRSLGVSIEIRDVPASSASPYPESSGRPC